MPVVRFCRGQQPLRGSHGLPHCKQLARLHSQSLIELRVRMLDGPAFGNALQLGSLPELRACIPVGEGKWPLNLRINPTSLEGAPQLQSLHLYDDEGLQMQQRSLVQLTVLTDLALVECGLRSVPSDVASLSATLHVLDLGGSGRLQVDGAAVASILACSELRTLGLYNLDIAERKHTFNAVIQ